MRDDPPPQRFVEPVEGFIQHQQIRPAGQGAGNGDPLLHAAGEFRGILPHGVRELHLFQHGERLRHRIRTVGENDIHVLRGRAPGKQAGFLKDRGGSPHIGGDQTGIRLLQRERDTQECRLSAAGGTHDGEPLAASEGEAAVGEDRLSVKTDRDVFQFKHGCRRPFCRSDGPASEVFFQSAD